MSKPNLCHGSGSAEHEDHLVGDEEGLRNLIHACEAALQDGEYAGNDLGEFVGVKKLDTTWFEKPADDAGFDLGGIACLVVFVALLILIVLGAVKAFELIAG